MFVDSRRVPHRSTLEADVCIVGAGAAGVTLALELEAAGLDVLLLEAGGLQFGPQVQAEYRGDTDPDGRHPAPELFRRRMFGGSTTIWGGRCVPLDPIDFERRDYVPHSGWPISYEQVAQHYPKAMAYCEAGQASFTLAEALPGAPPTLDAFESEDLVSDRIERFSPPTDFGRHNRNQLRLSKAVRVILGAPCTRIEMTENDRSVDRLWVDDGRFFIRARAHVVAMGGLETPRLLMASDQSRRGGIGNHSGALGRYYMCHLENTLSALQLTPENRRVMVNFETTDEKVYVRRHFALSEGAQREHRLLNACFRLHHPTIADPAHGHAVLSAMYFVKAMVLPEYRRKLATIEAAREKELTHGFSFHARHAANILGNMPELLEFSQMWLRQRTFAERKLPFVVVTSPTGAYPLDLNMEQAPNPDSRVRLSDAAGGGRLPRLQVDWHSCEADVESLVRTIRLVSRSFAQSETARLDIEDDNALVDFARASTPIGGHHIGTARMSAQPGQGVVDADCRVHGVSNLHICGSAVFPTSGFANPTLTIVALTIRLAQRLQSQLH